MTQVLLGTLMDTLNSGSLRGRCSVTHDLRNPDQPRVTAHESTTMFYPWVQGFIETFTLDPRLLQLKTFLTGRVRIRAGYAWGTNPEGGKTPPGLRTVGRPPASALWDAPPVGRSVPPPASALWDAPGKDGRPVWGTNPEGGKTEDHAGGAAGAGPRVNKTSNTKTGEGGKTLQSHR